MSDIIHKTTTNTTLSHNKKLVYGVGINDARYRVRNFVNGKMVWRCEFYDKWMYMLSRCYSKSCHKKYPTYIGCTVCEEWLRFSTFKRWMEQQDHKDKHLDKDLLIPGNKEYSPETCLFVTGEINTLFTHKRSDVGKCPTGVHFYKINNKYRAQFRKHNARVHIGYFDTIEEAEIAYQIAKINYVYELADNEPDERVANAIREYCQSFEYFFLSGVSV